MKNLLAIPSKPKVPEAETANTESLERTEVKLGSQQAGGSDRHGDARTRPRVQCSHLTGFRDRDGPRLLAKSSAGGSTAPMPQAESTINEAVFASDDLLVVEDVKKDERYSDNPLLLKRGVRAFASTPLRARSGHLVGNLCILDTQPREFSMPTGNSSNHSRPS